jgi:hypothetical protein
MVWDMSTQRAPALIGLRNNDAPWLDLLNEPGDYERVACVINRTIARSFQVDAQRHGAAFAAKVATQAEGKRRAEIIARWFEVLRREFGFSLAQTLDELPRALRAELDGGSYQPPGRNMLWSLQGDADLVH